MIVYDCENNRPHCRNTARMENAGSGSRFEAADGTGSGALPQVRRNSGALPHIAVQRALPYRLRRDEGNPRAAHVLADDIARCDGSAQGETCRLASDVPRKGPGHRCARPIAHRFQAPPSAYRTAHGADRIGRLSLGILLPAATRVALNACDLAVLGEPDIHDAPHRALDARDPPAHRAPPSTAGARRAESPLTADTTMREHPARLSASTFMRLI